jgi:NAD(P)-dependent dehydrogenase (short-subunit alcohol dehydrogenase family)/pimeloyl-ACP methyl ester carboxylesterase
MIPGARERRVDAGDVRLAVVEAGDPNRPTLLFVHGYPDSKKVWEPVMARLAERYHVVAYDVRGAGASTAPAPAAANYRLERLEDDVTAVLDSLAEGDGSPAPVHLIGHDWGSVQGWEFATSARLRGRFASFTSISGPCLDHFGHWMRRRSTRPTPRRLAQALGQGARSWYVYALHTPRLPELMWRGPLGRAWPGLLARVEHLPRSADYPGPTLPEDAANGAWLYRANVRDRMLNPRRDRIAHVPVQLIVPAHDPYLSPRLYDDLDEWVPVLRRRTLDSGHWAPRTRPDVLARMIAEFAEFAESAEGAAETAAGPARPQVASADPRAPRSHQSSRNARWTEHYAGRLALVTGAGSGIGRATALALAEAGARVVAVDRDAASATRTAELGALVARSGGQVHPEQADVSDERAMAALADKVHAQYGVLDLLVNNAGIGQAGPFMDTSTAEWKRVLDVNLWGVIHGCLLFGRAMAERGQGGHIVNIASAAALQPSRALPAYSTSKAAVLMLSECLRAELADRDIGVTAVCPGFVNTAITSTAGFSGVDEKEQARLRARSARLYRLRNYRPEKVAEAVLRAGVRNTAVQPVAPEAHLLRGVARLSPALRRLMARADPPV